MNALVGNVQLIAGSAQAIPALLALLKKESIATEGNPDLYVREYQSFGVEEARELRERASLKAVGTRRVFVIQANSMTSEAQNSLLKTLEEPVADALFLFLVPAPQTLLSTLRSRAQVLTLDAAPTESVVDVKKFLAGTAQSRLSLLSPLLEKGEDDKRDLGAIVSFLGALEHALRGKPQALGPVYLARKYVSDRGALVKPLLEQLALLVPRV